MHRYTVINVLNLLFTLLIYIQLYYKPTLIHVISQPPVYNQPEQMEEQLEESLELDVNLLSIDPPSDKKDVSFQPLSSTSTSTPSTEEEECEMHWKLDCQRAQCHGAVQKMSRMWISNNKDHKSNCGKCSPCSLGM